MGITVNYYTIDEGAIYFNYNDNKDAYLQLPATGDSQDVIDGKNDIEWSDDDREIYTQLVDNFRADFNNVECYAASCELCKKIEHVEEVNYKGRSIYVTFDENDNTDLLVESAYKDYYNKAALFTLFNQYDLFGYEDFNEEEVFEKARKQKS